MDLTTSLAAGWAALATIAVAILQRRVTVAQAKKTETDGELGITRSWADYAHGLESRLDRMQGRLDTLEKEAHFWREKHIESQTDYTRLEVQADALRQRVTHLEEENVALISILTANNLNPTKTLTSVSTKKTPKKTSKKATSRKSSSSKTKD